LWRPPLRIPRGRVQDHRQLDRRSLSDLRHHRRSRGDEEPGQDDAAGDGDGASASGSLDPVSGSNDAPSGRREDSLGRCALEEPMETFAGSRTVDEERPVLDPGGLTGLVIVVLGQPGLLGSIAFYGSDPIPYPTPTGRASGLTM